MADGTAISWAQATWSPVTGCTRTSEGCTHCYIERTPPFRMAHRRFDGGGIGSTTGVLLHQERLTIPLHWRKPRRIFVCSMSDLFHDHVPDEYIAKVWAVMAYSYRHTFQVLTKRHARMRALLSSPRFLQLFDREYCAIPDWNDHWPDLDHAPTGHVSHLHDGPLANVWIGISAEDQQWADIRIPALLDTPAAVRWVSAEPLLGPLDLASKGWLAPDECERAGLSWIVTGGESGPGARPMHPAWARSLRDQCVKAGVAFHFKQAGSVLAREWGCHGKGGDPSEWPEQFPREYPDA